MQTEVELTDDEMRQVLKVAEKLKVSSDDVIRLAVSQYLEREVSLQNAFGLWADRDEDGMAYPTRSEINPESSEGRT